MQVRSILLGCILALSIANAQASDLYKPNRFDRIQGYVAQTKIVQLFRYLFGGISWFLSKLERTDGGLASIEYQNLGKEAQQNLGINNLFHIPIKKISSVPIVYKDATTVAIAFPHAICLNEKSMNEESYGLKRTVLHHEATHAKYNDGTTIFLGMLLSSLTAGTIIHKLSDEEIPFSLSAFLGQILFTTGIYIFKNPLIRYVEHRADTEGFYATNCHKCINDVKVARLKAAEKRKKENQEDISKYGYLTPDETQIIIDQLKTHNRICSYHINEKKQNILDNKKEVLVTLKQIKEIKSILPKLSYYKKLAA